MAGASLQETLAQAQKLPPDPIKAKKNGEEAVSVGRGVKVEKKADGGGKDAVQKEEPLPKDLQALYPDADLSGVMVHYESPEAAKKGVQGFVDGQTIEVAPGVDRQTVLRHEIAHIVQQRAGQGKKGASEGKAEEQATKAETQKMSEEDLGAAPPGKKLNKETNANDRGMPKLEFNGFKFEKVSGEFNKELAKSDWEPKDLFKKEMWWRFPAFPAGGLYVKASGTFEPSAKLMAKASYSWDNTKKAFEVKGALEGELKAAVTFAVEGGAGINLVIQRGGVGLEAAATVEAFAKMSRSLAFSVSEKGVSFAAVPLEFEFGAALKAALSLVLWTDGWFWDDKWRWTFAEWTIASLTGYKGVFELGGGAGERVSAAYKHIRPGAFNWGAPPEATEASGKKI